jgi:hypothetical protein
MKNGEFQFSAKGIKKEGSSSYHSKIYTQVDGKTCLFEIIIGYYILYNVVTGNCMQEKNSND